ncbi:MAG: UbiX family flavin prenyltransferase, partial [Acidobacteriota bacterium]
MSETLRIVLAMTGASGSLHARRLLRRLAVAERVGEIHLVISDAARRVAHQETGDKASRAEELVDLWLEGLEPTAERVVHAFRDIGAGPASGSFAHDGMVVVPCSTATAASIAHGISSNLVHRAAECCLKERRRLILMIRETPLSLVHLENFTTLTRAGATVMPLAPPWYHRPQTLEDLVDRTCDRALDHLGLRELVDARWGTT